MLAEPASPSSLSELRALLRRKAPGLRQGPGDGQGLAAPALPTGVEAVDRLLGGGLPRGKLSELCGPRSSGRTALALAALAAATGRGEAVALVDVGGSLDVERAQAAGIALSRLLWMRADDAQVGLQAADVVLAAGGFPLVVLDVGEAPPRIADAGWMRLARAAEKAQAVVLLVSLRPATAAFSSLRLEASGRCRPRFLDPARGGALLGLEGTLAVTRSRQGGEGAEAPLRFRLRGGLLPAPAAASRATSTPSSAAAAAAPSSSRRALPSSPAARRRP